MKNHYALNPGEFFTAEELLQKRKKDLTLAFPLEDKGWDLLALKSDGSKPVRLQVKESRVYTRRKISWHQVILHAGKIEAYSPLSPVLGGAPQVTRLG